MRHRLVLLHVLLAIFLNGTSGGAQPGRCDLEVEVVSKQEVLGDCRPAPYECPYIRLEYPVVVAAPGAYAVDAINHSILSLLDPEMGEGAEPRSVDSLVRTFIHDFREFERGSRIWPRRGISSGRYRSSTTPPRSSLSACSGAPSPAGLTGCR